MPPIPPDNGQRSCAIALILLCLIGCSQPAPPANVGGAKAVTTAGAPPSAEPKPSPAKLPRFRADDYAKQFVLNLEEAHERLKGSDEIILEGILENRTAINEDTAKEKPVLVFRPYDEDQTRVEVRVGCTLGLDRFTDNQLTTLKAGDSVTVRGFFQYAYDLEKDLGKKPKDGKRHIQVYLYSGILQQ